jgi:nitric oxide reductase NorD protein
VAAGVRLAEVARVLGLVLRGLSGRTLRVEASPETFTDTETVFLPGEAASAQLYTAIAVHLWAQTRYGTFNAALALDAPARAWFNALEALRLEACLGRVYPGLARLLAALRGPLDPALARDGAALARPETTAQDSIRRARERAATGASPPVFPYLGSLRWEQARARRAARIERERAALAHELATLRAAHAPGPASAVGIEAGADGRQVRLDVDGEIVRPPERIAALVRSIVQDLGAVPPEYLAGAAPGRYDPDAAPGAAGADAAPEDGAGDGFRYDEWDFERRAYRKDWCIAYERDVPAGDPGFVAGVRRQYAGEIAQLRRRFEALRGEEKIARRERDGDDLDFDAAVDAYVDRRAGIEPSERVFALRRRTGRDIAVLFMVDMSGSTMGWINECERTAAVMLCEALEALGDRYAIYGFSGWGAKRCEIYRIKRFDERYAETVRGRIAGVQAKDYTRMGAAIRHLARLLNGVEARTRILFTLSDGKPDDYVDGYRGKYGIEDTRQALIEARASGIHPFCVTIDEAARDYLPHMYGQASWIVLDDVRKLPLKAADAYRRLTS